MHGCAIKQHVQSDSYALEPEYVLFKYSFCLAQTALFLQPRNKYHFVSSVFLLQWNYLLKLNPSLHSHHGSAYSLNMLHNDDYWCLLSFMPNCRALVKQPCRSWWKSHFFILIRFSKLEADLRQQQKRNAARLW